MGLVMQGGLADRSASPQNPSHQNRHLWVCVEDPDGAFLGNAFTLEMLRAGGFEDNTVFRHRDSGAVKAWREGQLVSE
jgi:hypothetical protein